MDKRSWDFFSNHGAIFLYVAQHPEATVRQMADDLNLCERAVAETIKGLRSAGYISSVRVGRHNLYAIHPEIQLQRSALNARRVSDLLVVPMVPASTG